SVSGPDSRRRIAFIENNMLEERHSLKLLARDKSERTLFEREGDALWQHSVGGSLALDSAGTRVAFVARAEGVEFKNPGAYLMQGELEVWTLDPLERIAPKLPALDDTLAWLPDGKHVLYTALIARSDAAKLLTSEVGAPDSFGS